VAQIERGGVLACLENAFVADAAHFLAEQIEYFDMNESFSLY